MSQYVHLLEMEPKAPTTEEEKKEVFRQDEKLQNLNILILIHNG